MGEWEGAKVRVYNLVCTFIYVSQVFHKFRVEIAAVLATLSRGGGGGGVSKKVGFYASESECKRTLPYLTKTFQY